MSDPAADVDEHRLRFIRRELGFTDQPLGRHRLRRGQHDDVGVREKLMQRVWRVNGFDAGHRRAIWLAPDPGHRRPERVKANGGRRANAAEADDQHPAAGNRPVARRRRDFVLRPDVLGLSRVRRREPPEQREHDRQDVLRDRVRRRPATVRDRDPAPDHLRIEHVADPRGRTVHPLQPSRRAELVRGDGGGKRDVRLRNQLARLDHRRAHEESCRRESPCGAPRRGRPESSTSGSC